MANTVLCFAFLYGRGELSIVFRLIVAHGHFPAIFVLLPLVSLVFAYAFSAAGSVAYLQGTKERAKEKKQPAEKKSPAETKRLPAPQDVGELRTEEAEAPAEGDLSQIED